MKTQQNSPSLYKNLKLQIWVRSEWTGFIEAGILVGLTGLPVRGRGTNYEIAANQGWLSNFCLKNSRGPKIDWLCQVNYGLLVLYKVENERNSKYIWVWPAKSQAISNIGLNAKSLLIKK